MGDFDVVAVDRACARLTATSELDAILEQRHAEAAENEDHCDLGVEPHGAANDEHGPDHEHHDQPDDELLDGVCGESTQHDGHYRKG